MTIGQFTSIVQQVHQRVLTVEKNTGRKISPLRRIEYVIEMPLTPNKGLYLYEKDTLAKIPNQTMRHIL